MANLSQCLDDFTPVGSRWPAAPPDLYSEAQRLALEELLSGGPEALRGFLHRERVPGFLSEPEVGEILNSASRVQCGEDEVSVSASVDCSTVTYFPEISDVEPPLLELGWPAFSAGSYRGATRVEVHFQPGFGETIYSCKETVRALIKGAREVIAVVMDSFTDNDIFRDIHEACRKRRVPVYILVDDSHLPHFLAMCQNLGILIETEQNMRVRTLTGNNYYTRSGAKIVGKAREKFLLVDGLKVATGSYSYTWMDGKLNSSNVIVLSGQIVEKFDLQFRILYAQSKPISTKFLMSLRNSNATTNKLPHALPAQKKPLMTNFLQMEIAKLSSTPKRAAVETKTTLEKDNGMPGKVKASEEDWLQNCDIISGLKETETVSTQTEPSDGWWNLKGKDVSTQTNVGTSTAGTQTAVLARMASTQTVTFSRPATTQTTQVQESSTETSKTASVSAVARVSSSSTSSSTSSSSSASTTSTASDTSIRSSSGLNHSDYNMRDSFKKLGKDRQLHYTSIRSKLDHMVSILSRRNRFTSSYFNCEPTPYGFQRRDVMHSSLLNLRDGVRFAPHM
ncbi:protein FAM83D isoform X2 [Rana temporaria]|uniref:protein FAM83D isoform X2 n=1 Tax=Rana temporaria TaxID=8407 RepID=UPI001AAD587F|nr:protein FAM83D isoform X2 [Rana temporaria]